MQVQIIEESLESLLQEGLKQEKQKASKITYKDIFNSLSENKSIIEQFPNPIFWSWGGLSFV